MYIINDYFLNKYMIWYLVKPNYMYQQTNKETQESITFSNNKKMPKNPNESQTWYGIWSILQLNIQLEQKGFYNKSQMSVAGVHRNKKNLQSL